MKRTFKYALSTVLAVGIVLPAIAQDQFPDVPENHWAYEALARLKKDGLLIGYPDGKYRGARPATRYELAVAIHAAYTNLKGITDGLDAQIKALDEKIKNLPTGGGDGVSKADFNALKDAVDALKNDVAGVKNYGDDIAALKKAADTFQKELSSLGVDVEALKKDLGDIAARVKALENKKPTVDISGDVNLWIGAGNSRDGAYGLTTDGRITGTTNPGTPGLGNPAGLSRDLSVIHELGLSLKGTGGPGVDWMGTLVVGNALGSTATPGQFGLGSQSNVAAGYGLGYSEASSDTYLQNFEVHFNSSVAGLGFSAKVGRIGYKVSPYILQRQDTTSYYSNERWDNGNYALDGAALGFGTGAVKIGVVAGKLGNQLSGNGVQLQSVTSGTAIGVAPLGKITLDRVLGITADAPLTSKGSLNLAYLWLDSNTSNGAVGADRLAVYGGSVNFALSNKIGFTGGYSKAVAQLGTTNVNDSDNAAWNAGLKYDGGKFNLGVSYREIEANYLAPGDWGRLGIIRNQTNIKGFTVNAGLALSEKLSLSATGEFNKGKADGFTSTFFDTGTKSTTVGVNLKYALRPDLALHLGFENTQFENVTAPGLAGLKPQYRWITAGVSHNLSDASKLMIQYQISDVKNEFQLNGANNGDFKGGFLTTQLSIKF
jgi:hypothetical protein